MNAMEPASILIVEDEPVVAKDIQLSLQRLGYRVPATATSGEEAIRKASDMHPDLILMDIVLKGKMDGVETALQIQRKQDVPVIYLTAYADNHTLERAKVTSPAGYMLKPYQANELRTTIELALHRAQHERHMRERLRWIATTMRLHRRRHRDDRSRRASGLYESRRREPDGVESGRCGRHGRDGAPGFSRSRAGI
jgi:CheY-like chemotaxis protein